MEVDTKGEDDHGSINYGDLETAAFNNTQGFVREWWLNSGKDQQNYGWLGSLLSQAAYHHSVDVVRCIVSFGNCDGQSSLITST